MQANRFGIGRFLRESVEALRTEFPQHQYALFTLPHRPNGFHRGASPARLLRGAHRWLWLQTGLPHEAARRHVQVLFCPDYLAPFRPPCPLVVMVHDLVFRLHPQWGERVINWELAWCLPAVIRRAARLVTPSASSRHALLEAMRCPPERVVVVPEGVGALFRPLPADQVYPTLARYRLEQVPFLLSVGTWSPRKNLARLLQAFAALRSWYPGRLVLVGGGGWSRRPVEEAISAYGVADRVDVVGFVPDEDLPALYNGAELFAFPSLYEGFGLPILEAMACGCPVVTSNASSMPEVAGEAAVLVDPLSVGDLTAALRGMLQDQGRRERYHDAGLTRAGHFRWAATAAALEGVFREVCSS